MISIDTEDSFITADWGKNCGLENPELVFDHVIDSNRPWLSINRDLETEVKRWTRTTSGNIVINGYWIKFLHEDEETEYKLRFL